MKNFTAIVTALSLLLLPTLCLALQESPWLSNSLEFQWHADYCYQHYSQVQTKYGHVKRSSDDIFLNSSLELSAFDFSGEIEYGASKTHCHNFSSDHFSAQLRYQWLDDILYDPISVVSALVITHVCGSARHDISEFYHGTTVFEGNVSFGKEQSCQQYWFKRRWALLGLGIGDHGSPYIRADMTIESNWYDYYYTKCFIRTLWGLGNKKLILEKPFHGYGSIHHQTVDIGFEYGRQFDNCGTIFISYSIRAFARNAPLYAQLLQVNFLYPFGV